MTEEKVSTFSRTLANARKMGAYYTDVEHCRRIGYLFDFTADEFCTLEPSIGDAKAICTVLGEAGGARIFGVELNTETYSQYLKGNDRIAHVLNADFLSGIKVSHSSFGFCFANPPYGKAGDGERLETKFVEKLHPYLKGDAPLALVVPYYILRDEKFLKVYMARFQPLRAFRFDDDVYKEFKQVVIVGLKRRSIGYLRQAYDAFMDSIKEQGMLPYLPKTEEEAVRKIRVVPSRESDMEYFTTLRFNAGAAAENLSKSSLYRHLGDYTVPRYTVTEIGNPPVPLKKDLLYLLAISGGGQGMVGSEANQDLHLQRGVAKVVETVSYEETQGEDMVQVVNSHTEMSINIIENDGTITVLK